MQINSDTNRVQMQVRGLTLDELELASLRGDLQNLSLDLNFLKKEGRGELQMSNPRHTSIPTHPPHKRGGLCLQVQWSHG